jgi:hypothetical protein
LMCKVESLDRFRGFLLANLSFVIYHMYYANDILLM